LSILKSVIMKNKLLLVSCALFLFSGTAFAENLLVTKTSGGADEEGTLPYVVANAPGGSVIELSIGDETTVTIPETILIDKNLTIDGKGKTISVAEPGVSNYRIFKIGLYEPEDGAELISLTLKNCTLYGGDGTALVDTETTMATWSATILVGANGTLIGENLLFDKAKNGYAAGIMACGDITLTNCTFQNLSGTKAGGALYTNKGVTGRFTNCTFTNNTSEAHGGAVCCSGSTNYFTDCVFTGNTSTGKSTNGGAIFLQNAGASAEIINCTFTENTATNYGGAVEQNNNVTDGALKIVNTTFTNNTAKGGGALLTWMGDITVEHCSFEHNEATGTSGGAWYASLKTAVTYKVAGCYFGENLSAAHGGAILSTSKNATFTNCTFYKNEITGANNGGGALALQGDATIYNCTFVDNKGVHETYGSGIHIASKAIVQIYNSILVRGIGGPDIYTHNDCAISGTHNIYGTALEGTPVITDEFVDNVVYTDQKLFAEDGPIPALNEGTTKNIAIAADGIAAGAGIVVEGVPTVDQRGKSRSATNPAIGSYEVEKATSIERVAVEKLFWPNPAQGNINLTEGVSNIAIYDLQGSLVKEVAMPAQSVSVEGLNPGIYLIRITLNGNEHNHRLVIK
jgi:predicted outer membrane repeat protein